MPWIYFFKFISKIRKGRSLEGPLSWLHRSNIPSSFLKQQVLVQRKKSSPTPFFRLDSSKDGMGGWESFHYDRLSSCVATSVLSQASFHNIQFSGCNPNPTDGGGAENRPTHSNMWGSVQGLLSSLGERGFSKSSLLCYGNGAFECVDRWATSGLRADNLFIRGRDSKHFSPVLCKYPRSGYTLWWGMGEKLLVIMRGYEHLAIPKHLQSY